MSKHEFQFLCFLLNKIIFKALSLWQVSSKIVFFDFFQFFWQVATIFKGVGEYSNSCKTTLTTKPHLTQHLNDPPNWPVPCLLRMPSASKLGGSLRTFLRNNGGKNYSWWWAAWWSLRYPDSVFQRYLQRNYYFLCFSEFLGCDTVGVLLNRNASKNIIFEIVFKGF